MPLPFTFSSFPPFTPNPSFLLCSSVFILFFLTVEKKQGSIFFLPVFMINIHNLPQFVNHTVALVQNKYNNERISLK